MGKLFTKLMNNMPLSGRAVGSAPQRILDSSLKIAKGPALDFFKKSRERRKRAEPPMTIMGPKLGG